MNRKKNKTLLLTWIRSLSFHKVSESTPMELIPEVEDEEETQTCLGLPSASPLPLSNPLEQD
jgi:hypothetical protein